MINAKEEFLQEVEDKSMVCASVSFGANYDGKVNFVLKRGHSESDHRLFIESLNFKYDNGFGGQRVFGYIWYDDGTWSSRGEYDGSEWWEHNVVPDILEECTANTKE